MARVNISEKNMNKEFLLLRIDNKERKIVNILSGDNPKEMLRKFI